MISDEEKVRELFIHHPPTYRSDRLNTFIDKLDERLSKLTTGYVRHPRVLVSPRIKDVLASAKAWMVKEYSTDPAEGHINQSDQDLFETDSSGIDGSDCD